MMTQEEIKEFKEKALKQFLSGESLTGKDGAFSPMLKEFLEEALEAEMASHLSDEEKGAKAGNKRNGKGQKTIKSTHGDVTISTPQDRHSTFEPEIVEKRQRILANNLEKQIIGMYGLGNSLRDISDHIEQMYTSNCALSTRSAIA